jgi:hypothetical protein
MSDPSKLTREEFDAVRECAGIVERCVWSDSPGDQAVKVVRRMLERRKAEECEPTVDELVAKYLSDPGDDVRRCLWEALCHQQGHRAYFYATPTNNLRIRAVAHPSRTTAPNPYAIEIT